MMPTPVRDPLKISVPKKLLPRAIDRNLVRRIVREAWRASGKASASSAPSCPSLLLRLRSKPSVFVDGGVDARRRQVRAEVDRLLMLAIV